MKHLLCAGFLVLSLAVSAFGSGSSPIPSPPSASDSAASKRAKLNAIFQEGKELLDQKKYAAAEAKFSDVTSQAPGYAEAWNELGFSQRKQKKYDDAIKSYEKAINLKPTLDEAYEYLGEAYVELALKSKAAGDTAGFASFKSKAEAQLQKLKDLKSDEAEELKENLTKLN